VFEKFVYGNSFISFLYLGSRSRRAITTERKTEVIRTTRARLVTTVVRRPPAVLVSVSERERFERAKRLINFFPRASYRRTYQKGLGIFTRRLRAKGISNITRGNSTRYDGNNNVRIGRIRTAGLDFRPTPPARVRTFRRFLSPANPISYIM